MNTSYGDLKDIFSTPPTEARYSWIIRNGNHTLEGSEIHRSESNSPAANPNSPAANPNFPAPNSETRQQHRFNTTVDGTRMVAAHLQEDANEFPGRDYNNQVYQQQQQQQHPQQRHQQQQQQHPQQQHQQQQNNQEQSKKRQAPQPPSPNKITSDPQFNRHENVEHGEVTRNHHPTNPSNQDPSASSHNIENNRKPKRNQEQLLLDISLDQGMDTKQEVNNAQNGDSYPPNRHSPLRSQGGNKSPNQQRRGRTNTGLLVETKEQNTTNNQNDITTSPRLSDSYSSSSPRVFGGQYNRTKRTALQRPLAAMSNQNGGGGAVTVDQVKNMRLQEELNSAHKKINRLNHINQNALKRKGELQQEVLEAYKKISDLEVGKQSWHEKQRDLTSQLNAAKQRVGDAEREAAHAIGNISDFFFQI